MPRVVQTGYQTSQQQLNLLDESARMVTAHPKDLGGTQEPVQLLDFVDRFAERKLGVQKVLQSLDERIASHEKSVAIKLARLARKG